MKVLIEDYKRRLVTAENIIEAFPKANLSRAQLETQTRINTKASEYRTMIAELEREYKPKLSAYNDVWVVVSYAGSDVDHVFTDKEEAEKEAKRLLEEYLAYYRKLNKRMNDEEWEEYSKNDRRFRFKVVSLDSAIDAIKDNIRDEEASRNDPSY